MRARRRIWIATVGVMAISAGCAEPSERSSRPTPESFVVELLEMHDLNGKNLQDRSDGAKKQPVDRAALSRLFSDYNAEDPFLADLYVGFIVGSLAAEQGHLQAFESGNRAEIHTGKIHLKLQYRDGVWQASLRESVPESIKARAKMEKLRVSSVDKVSIR